MNKKRPANDPDAVHPARKTLLFRLLLLLIPLLFFAAAEVGLRLAGYGDNLDLFIDLEQDPTYLITNPRIGRRYFQRSDFLPATSYDAFAKKKAANAYRIFVLGGSSAAGFPYFHNGAFSRMLKTRLQDRYADLHIEIVNLALPAVNSHTLLDFADEIVAYSPDAVLIYAGHNEFYGAFGAGSTESMGTRRKLIQLYLDLLHFKVVQAVRDLVFSFSSGAGDERTLMARMVARQEIVHGGETYRAALRVFRDNLSEIVAILQKHGVDVAIGELVSNLKDQAPFVSSHGDSADRAAWQDSYDLGLQALEAGQASGALEHLAAAQAIDDRPAALNYHKARALLQLNRIDEARAAFIRAKDLDALRFRASEEFNRIIREVAGAAGVPVAAMIPAFAQASPLGLIGDELMVDHLHPNLRGHGLMARAFFTVMENNRFLPAGHRRRRVGSDAQYMARIAVTQLDRELAAIRMQVLRSDWPFRPLQEARRPLDYTPASRVQELALAQWREEIAWDDAHLQLAQYYERNRETEKAAEEYAAVVAGMPYAVAPYLRLGLTYLNLNRVDEAQAVFMASLDLEPTAIAQKWLGSIFVHNNQVRAGIDLLTEALRREAGDPEILYNLSVGYAKSGILIKAMEYAETLVRQQPDYPGAREHLQKLRDMAR